MEITVERTAWSQIGGGIRPSHWLKFGAGLLAFGILGQLLLEIAGSADRWPILLLVTPWWIFTLALVFVGAGFVTLGARPFMNASAWLPGIAHLLQAFLVVVLLLTGDDWLYLAPYPPLVKYAALAVFASMSTQFIGATNRNLVLAVCFAEGFKILGREFGIVPNDASLPLDAVLLAAQAWVLWRLATAISHQEDVWASVRKSELSGRWEDFDRHRKPE